MDPLEAQLRRQLDKGTRLFWHRVRWAAVREYLPTTPFSLTDIGAGAGLLGEFLARERPDATYRFVEPIPALERSLERRHGTEANSRDAPAYEGIVALLDVLEHQKDDREFLADLVSRIRPRSTLLITVPAMRSLWSGWDVALGHYRRYERAVLRTRLEEVPAEILEVSYLFPELVPAGHLRKRLRPTDARAAVEEASFPRLPRWLDDALYALGRKSLAARHWMPLGTSLFAAVTVAEEPTSAGNRRLGNDDDQRS